ncbi:McrB family protein [Crassaminicella profunda]|uniref:McrB family protein n=1 Tax=Crassaminicella profunda TaxID=1286698 RepID=UPI001CA77D38|nr:AAA family ATPase [Crassaminicella profunda]QZY53891.1 AAA family ATPase [Crassaminicella profunda]
MTEKKEINNCWYLEEMFYEKSDDPEKLLNNNIIALGFDKNVDLREAIDDDVDIEEYIQENCKVENSINDFTKIKKGDYILYRAYKKDKDSIDRITYIGEVKKGFRDGYKLNSNLGHTLPIKWIDSKCIELKQSIYTGSLKKIEKEEVKDYLGDIGLEKDEGLSNELESSINNKWRLKNYYCSDVQECIDNNEIIISPRTIEQINNLNSMKKDDYIFVYNAQKVLNKKNTTKRTLKGVCKIKADLNKEYTEQDYKLNVEWIEEAEVIDENFSAIIEFRKDRRSFRRIISNTIFNKSLNTILYGPPGTGKTYNVTDKSLQIINYLGYSRAISTTHNIRKFIMRGVNNLTKAGRMQFCTFHQAYGYEEFIEGLKSDGDGNFKPEDGVLKGIALEACYEGLKIEKKIELEIDKDNLKPSDIKERKKKLVLENIHNNDSFDFSEAKTYILIIDEINRGNIAKIFGELITLLEEDKRLTKENQVTAKLPYSKEEFCLPPNLYIIGTMNTADKSIALMDVALRRRFRFEEMMPNPSLLQTVDNIDLKIMLEKINDRIEFLYDRDYMIGHAYLINVKNIDDISDVFKNKIIPLLQEYFYDDWEKIGLILGGIGKNESDKCIVYKKDIRAFDLFKDNSIANKYGSKTKYYIKSSIGFEELKNIYE